MQRILALGDPRLRRVSDRVDPRSPEVADLAVRLHAILADFRASRGFGRAIAAPQIGASRRVIALDLGDGPRILVNPEITWRGDADFTLWDDCLSFPDLLVRLRRDASVTVEFADERGEHHVWDRLDPAVSELLQHELDHLDGVLAVDRALDRDSIVLRAAWDEQPDYFRAMVTGPGG